MKKEKRLKCDMSTWLIFYFVYTEQAVCQNHPKERQTAFILAIYLLLLMMHMPILTSFTAVSALTLLRLQQMPSFL